MISESKDLQQVHAILNHAYEQIRDLRLQSQIGKAVQRNICGSLIGKIAYVKRPQWLGLCSPKNQPTA